jgi:PAS domain S-box-containing protein
MARDITERARAAAALRDSEERLREALQMGKMYAIEWDVATDVVIRSDEANHVYDLTGESTQPTHRQMLERVHPEDRAEFARSIAELSPANPNCRTSFRVLRNDGTIVWLERTGHAFFDAQGKMVRMIGIVANITERKLAERQTALANDRLRMAMESGRWVGWDRDVKSGRDVLFGDLNSIFGIPVQTLVGGVEDFHRRVHPEDRGRIVKTIDDAMESRKPYSAEFRVVLPGGAARWLSAKGRFYYSPGGEPERMIGMAVDITERKLAEEALSTVSQKLIEAQEQERSRLARELHDDINQRMGLLAVSLDRIKRNVPSSAVQFEQQIDEARKQVADIAQDVQTVSDRLHTPKLAILGLTAAAKSLCREFSELHRVQIECRSEGVPKELPRRVSLSLFRVLQEALQNAAKHSGSRHFRVALTGGVNKVELTVHDSGRGFELEEAIRGRGLGLTSMRERLKLVDGRLSIDTHPQRGTTLHAQVPLDPSGEPAETGG